MPRAVPKMYAQQQTHSQNTAIHLNKQYYFRKQVIEIISLSVYIFVLRFALREGEARSFLPVLK